MTAAAFEHQHSAHCESGAFNALLRHHGVRLTEAMVFGIGSGLFFLHFPFVRIYGAPLVAYRDAPNAIIRRSAKRLGVRVARERFRDPARGMAALDAALARGTPVGLQTGVFWLPYFPRDMRFQFNGHHVVAYGKEAGEYLLSDTVFDTPVRCAADDLQRARFARGPLAPRGLLYHIVRARTDADLAAAARSGLAQTAARMLRIPLPWMGVRGMRSLARAMAGWPRDAGAERARQWLANTIRMQEEIGTGGGGFRFMYAAFVAEAADLIARPALRQVAEQFAEAGDRWRAFAVAGAQVIRHHDDDPAAFAALARQVNDCAALEETACRGITAAL